MDTTRNLILVGSTGVGKSALGNFLLGENVFETSAGTNSCTVSVDHYDGTWLGQRNGRQIRVIDIPGHGDNQNLDEKRRKETVDAIKEVKGVNVVVWVKNSESPRIDKQEAEWLGLMPEMFGEGLAKNLIIVLTRWSFSEDAIRRREKKGEILQDVERNIWQHTREREWGSPQILTIDVLHNDSNALERERCLEDVGKLKNFLERKEKRLADIRMANTEAEQDKKDKKFYKTLAMVTSAAAAVGGVATGGVLLGAGANGVGVLANILAETTVQEFILTNAPKAAEVATKIVSVYIASKAK